MKHVSQWLSVFCISSVIGNSKEYMIYTLIQVPLLDANPNTQMCSCLIKHNKWCTDGDWQLPCNTKNRTGCPKRKLTSHLIHVSQINHTFYGFYSTTLTTAGIITPMIHEQIRMEHCRNDTDRATPLYSERNLFWCQSVHQKPHVELFGTESRPPRWEVDDQEPERRHCPLNNSWNFWIMGSKLPTCGYNPCDTPRECHLIFGS
jgi:hypothetical protein